MKKRNHRSLSAVLAVLCVWPLLFLASCRHGGHSVSETGGADSVYTLRHIRSIAIEHPERALALIDTAEKKRLLTAFDINDLRSLVYHNGLSRYKTALFYARKAYNDPEARKDPRRYLSLLSIMADESRSNGDYTGSMKYCTEGLELAKELGDKTYEANLNVMWGVSQMEMAQYDEAFASIGLAIGLLEEEVRKDPSYHAWDELYYALGMKLALLFEKDRNEEAYAMRPLIKKAIQGLEKSEDTPEGLVDMRRAEADVCFSCVAYTLGDKAEGDSLYRRVEANPYASTPDGEYIRIPCLVLAKRYDEALYYIRREKKLLQETTDTVSWDYINPHLQAELEAWQGKGDWRSVARVQATMFALADTLRRRERTEDALELAKIYETEEKDREIERQGERLRRHNLILALLIPTLLLLVFYLSHILKNNRIISRKNAAMTQTIDELMAYKDELLEWQQENLRLREELRQLRPAFSDGDSVSRPSEEEEKERPMEKETLVSPREVTERDRALYERMNSEIVSRQLYLHPDFNKQELLKEFHIPANKFAALFKVFAGCGFSQYVQELRLDHAVRLMRSHPQWTLDAIAKASQMSNGAFYSQFQKKYGMKPSDYRKH